MLYRVFEQRPGSDEQRELARVIAPSGGIALQGKGEVVSGDPKALGFNVKRNQSVVTTRRKNGKVRRVVKAKPVKE